MEYVRECNYKRIGNGKETKNLKEFCICFYSLVSKISFHVKNHETRMCKWYTLHVFLCNGDYTELHIANLFIKKKLWRLVNKCLLRYFKLIYSIQTSFLVIPTLINF